jgi:hypothetical protein
MQQHLGDTLRVSLTPHPSPTVHFVESKTRSTSQPTPSLSHSHSHSLSSSSLSLSHTHTSKKVRRRKRRGGDWRLAPAPWSHLILTIWELGGGKKENQVTNWEIQLLHYTEELEIFILLPLVSTFEAQSQILASHEPKPRNDQIKT